MEITAKTKENREVYPRAYRGTETGSLYLVVSSIRFLILHASRPPDVISDSRDWDNNDLYEPLSEVTLTF